MYLEGAIKEAIKNPYVTFCASDADPLDDDPNEGVGDFRKRTSNNVFWDVVSNGKEIRIEGVYRDKKMIQIESLGLFFDTYCPEEIMQDLQSMFIAVLRDGLTKEEYHNRRFIKGMIHARSLPETHPKHQAAKELWTGHSGAPK